MHCQMLYRQVNLFELYSVLLGLKPFEPDHSIPYIIASAHRLHVRTSKLVGNALTHLLLILSFYGLQTIRAGEKNCFQQSKSHGIYIRDGTGYQMFKIIYFFSFYRWRLHSCFMESVLS